MSPIDKPSPGRSQAGFASPSGGGEAHEVASRGAIVKLDHVYKSFGSNQVLKGKGEVFAIIGRSGSGKSTALRCIDRLERIDQGRIQVCGHEVSDPKLDLRQLRRDVGIVFQSYNLFPHLTAAENIALAPRHSKGKTRAEAASSPPACSRRWACRTRPRATRSSSRAASSSAWPSRARSPWSRRSCCSTK
jgi:polar amino acid transport system ATP-binding protein